MSTFWTWRLNKTCQQVSMDINYFLSPLLVLTKWKKQFYRYVDNSNEEKHLTLHSGFDASCLHILLDIMGWRLEK